MREALDYFFSSMVLMVITVMTIIFLCVGFAFKNPFKRKSFNSAYKIGLYALAFCFMMSFNFFYYGYADSFERMAVGKSTICLMESYERGGEGPSEHVCRLHIINKYTGERKERYYVGSYSELLGMRNDTLCYLRDYELVVFDAANLREVYSVKKDNWGSISSELAIGIDNVYGNQNHDSGYKPLIELSCKNGKRYWFDPFSKRLFNTEPTDVRLLAFTKRNDELTIDAGPGRYRSFVRTEYANEKLKRIVPGEYGRKFFSRTDSTAYIEPFLLCMDTIKNVLVFGHYTSTDKKEFYLETKDSGFKTTHKKLISELTNDTDNEEPKVDVWYYEQGILYFNSGGFLMALEPQSFHLLWSKRL